MNTNEQTLERHHPTMPEPVDLLQSPSSSCASPSSFISSDKETKRTGHMRSLGRKGSVYAFRIRDHVRLGPKLSETLKCKLSLGARIIQEGGRHNIFKHVFGAREGEELLKASQCYLSTTSGPIAGLLFISTDRVAFCSDRSIPLRSQTGEVLTTPYKVVIPIRKIKNANQCENVEKPAQKYIEIVTNDGFEFWFMGFLRYEKAFKNLETAIAMSTSTVVVAEHTPY